LLLLSKIGYKYSYISFLDKAGGLKDEADITNINLAYIIEDGMKIHIPSKEEKESTIIVESNIDSGTVGQSNEIKSNNNKKLKININTATKTDLETLPGIGESTALKIIEYRKEKGKFKLIEDAVGVVEIILILVVLISLVVIFKEQLTALVKKILAKITKQSNAI